ncbi:vesicle-associated membrane protein 3 [Colossoma macropomum]|uniref:vesicle-associated membrane protein 3 n=1 Tax=Colossoma macropomum TaxID=42526 RepID=UPI0018656619|nr:vesicle-associated membrane protein 3 [Colossoma macropomum]
MPIPGLPARPAAVLWDSSANSVQTARAAVSLTISTEFKQRRVLYKTAHLQSCLPQLQRVLVPQEWQGGNRRLQQTQAQVDEVVDIMRVNVDKVLERDQKLSELDDRADALQAGASQFETNAAKLKRKYWWKNCKMWAILIAVIIIIIVIIIIWNKS